MKHFVLILIIVAGLAGCAAPRVAGECSSNSRLRCLSERVCSMDTSRGCVVCSCVYDSGGYESPTRDNRPQQMGTGEPRQDGR